MEGQRHKVNAIAMQGNETETKKTKTKGREEKGKRKKIQLNRRMKEQSNGDSVTAIFLLFMMLLPSHLIPDRIVRRLTARETGGG